MQQLDRSLSENHESLWRCEPANAPRIAVGRVPERPAKIRVRIPTKVDDAKRIFSLSRRLGVNYGCSHERNFSPALATAPHLRGSPSRSHDRKHAAKQRNGARRIFGWKKQSTSFVVLRLGRTRLREGI